jgi:hypothetical protein
MATSEFNVSSARNIPARYLTFSQVAISSLLHGTLVFLTLTSQSGCSGIGDGLVSSPINKDHRILLTCIEGKSITCSGCNYGIYVQSAVVGGTIYVLDSSFSNTYSAVVINSATGSTKQKQMLVTLDNVVLSSVTYAVYDLSANVVLNGGTMTISSWVIGTVYDSANPNGAWFNGKPLDAPHPNTASLRGGPQGGYFERQKPTYATTTHNYWLIAQALAKGWSWLETPSTGFF